jgi:flagellar basal-body rod protein FlgC
MGVDPVAISRSALDVEWQRMQVVAQNIANQGTSRVGGGGAYRPMQVVSGPAGTFGSLVEPGGVRVVAIEARQGGVRRAYDPGHPDADRDGFVAMPDISPAAEMALLVKTARVYESNLTALSLAQQMSMRALELGTK